MAVLRDFIYLAEQAKHCLTPPSVHHSQLLSFPSSCSTICNGENSKIHIEDDGFPGLFYFYKKNFILISVSPTSS